MNPRKARSTAIPFLTMIVLFVLQTPAVWGAGPRSEAGPAYPVYSIPAKVLEKPFRFAGELIPLDRKDVRDRIRFHLNFLLLDARSVLTDWLMTKGRRAWIFDEIFAKQGIPQDFVLLAPVLSGLKARNSSRTPGVGPWALDRLCRPSEGVPMSRDSWHDDRRDLNLSTRCFAARLKGLRKQLPGAGWLMATAAYVSSAKEILQRIRSWNTQGFWDLQIPKEAEDLICRWIALGIIDSNRKAFGLSFKEKPPLTYDHVSDLVLTKDLPVAEIARATGSTSRRILELNPKIKVSSGKFPARIKGRRLIHNLAAPKGKGWKLVKNLEKRGYLATRKGR